jgi:hypothetical protein
MPHNLPIYDNLLNIIEREETIVINDKIKNNLIVNICEYKDTHELLFAIIRCYQLNNSSNINKLPFYCKFLKTKQGFKFDMDNLPDKLIRVIMEFYNLHMKSLGEKKELI